MLGGELHDAGERTARLRAQRAHRPDLREQFGHHLAARQRVQGAQGLQHPAQPRPALLTVSQCVQGP